MGGLIILAAILIPTLLFARVDNIYIMIMVFSTIWLGFIGFADDYIKVFKQDKHGLAGKFKILGQVVIGLIVGLTMVFHSDIVVKEDINLLHEKEIVGSALILLKNHLEQRFLFLKIMNLIITI